MRLSCLTIDCSITKQSKIGKVFHGGRHVAVKLPPIRQKTNRCNQYTYDGETSYATVNDAVANNFAATEVSAYEAEYYTDGNTSFAEVATVSSFGTVVKGNGTIKYSFTGSKFALNVRQDEACEIVVKLDGKETRVTLSANSNKTLAFVVEGLTQGEHTVEVTVLQGNICVDSLYVG